MRDEGRCKNEIAYFLLFTFFCGGEEDEKSHLIRMGLFVCEAIAVIGLLGLRNCMGYLG